MSMGDMQAFPVPASNGYDLVPGLTKREYAAIQIAAGLATNARMAQEDTVEIAVQITDALIAELEK